MYYEIRQKSKNMETEMVTHKKTGSENGTTFASCTIYWQFDTIGYER